MSFFLYNDLSNNTVGVVKKNSDEFLLQGYGQLGYSYSIDL